MRTTRFASTNKSQGFDKPKRLGPYYSLSVWFWSRASFLVILASIGLSDIEKVSAEPRIDHLRCEYLENPLGIETAKPRLSWILAPDTPSVRGWSQTAYQILVASSTETLSENVGDIWDSGRVESDRSIQIPFDGNLLAARSECFWKVRVWDQHGDAIAWSKPASWTMGLFESADWQAKWIGLNGDEDLGAEPVLKGSNWIWYPEGKASEAVPVGARYFRRIFNVPIDRKVKRAQFIATADDEYSAFINHRDVGGHDDYRTLRESDLTSDIKPGENLIAVVCKNKGHESNPAGFVGVLTIEFDQGLPLVIHTDDKWKASDTDEPGWNTALGFDKSHWKAALATGPVGIQPWGDVRIPEDRRLSARYLRKEFSNEKRIRRATASYSGLGFSELYINGEKIGDHVLSPGTTEYPKRVLYVTHDVTDQIEIGKNAVGVILGNGRYALRSEVDSGLLYFGSPKLLLNLHIEYEDGSQRDILSDVTWKVTPDGPIRGNSEFDGEDYDARMELTGWSKPGFNDSEWQTAELDDAPEIVVSSQVIDPIRVIDSIRPIKITEPRPGIFIFDLGQNIVGWCQLRVKGPAGSRVSLRHAETVNPDGTLDLSNLLGAKVTDSYTLNGGDEETWEPRFTYHGFRFVELSGFPGEPSLDTLTGRVVHDDLEVVGQFTCSNELFNHIYQNIVWGISGNYRSIPTDCPQRAERLGWLGDRSEESKGESYLFNISALYSKWLRDMEDSQLPSGSVPDVCPAHQPVYTDNVTWPSSSVILPNMLYRQYGDADIVARHYECAKKWVDYMLSFVQDGIIDRDSYGDWCFPPKDPSTINPEDPTRSTDKVLLATSYLYYDLKLMEKYAVMQGKAGDAERFAKQAQELSTGFNKRFLKTDLNQYDNGSQTSCVLPLHFGLVPEEQQKKVFQLLVDNIEHHSHGHIGTGLIGGQYLNQVLSDYGRADLSFTMASQTDYPSWGYMISQGATTIWEHWNGDTADPKMVSRNHVMLVGDLVIWFYEYLAGIAPDDASPGFKHIVMRPHLVGDLTFVEASFFSPYGLIRSKWRKRANEFQWQITVPPNTTATVYVPADDASYVTESGRNAIGSDGVSFIGSENDRAVFAIGSGDYEFRSKCQESFP